MDTTKTPQRLGDIALDIEDDFDRAADLLDRACRARFGRHACTESPSSIERLRAAEALAEFWGVTLEDIIRAIVFENIDGV